MSHLGYAIKTLLTDLFPVILLYTLVRRIHTHTHAAGNRRLPLLNTDAGFSGLVVLFAFFGFVLYFKHF